MRVLKLIAGVRTALCTENDVQVPAQNWGPDIHKVYVTLPPVIEIGVYGFNTLYTLPHTSDQRDYCRGDERTT